MPCCLGFGSLILGSFRHDFLRLAKKGLLRKRQSEFDYDAFFSSASASYSYSYDYDTTPSYSIDYMSDYMDSFSSILDEYTNNLNSFSSFDYDSYYTSLLASLTANNPALESLFLTDNSPYQGSYYSSISNALKSSLDAVATATGSVKPTSTSSGSSSGSKEDGGSGMSKTAIIGIVVAVVILVIAALIGWCVWRRRHPKTPKPKLEVLQTGPGHVPIPGPGPQVPISNGPDASALPGKDGSFYAPPGPPQPPVSPPPTVHSPPPPIYPNNKTELDGGSTLAPNAAGNVPSRHPTPTPPIHGVFETEARPWSVPPVAPSATGTVTSGTTLAHNPSTVSSMTRSSHGEVYSPGQAMYGRVHEAGGHEIPAHQQPPRQPERDRPMQAPYEPQGPIFEMGDQR